jgi:hypothetical protein
MLSKNCPGKCKQTKKTQRIPKELPRIPRESLKKNSHRILKILKIALRERT